MVMNGEINHMGAICECGRTVETLVMKSPAGFYVGTQCPAENSSECMDSISQNSRETGYFSTHEEAQASLDYYNETGIFINGR